MSPEMIRHNGSYDEDIGKVDVGRAEDLEKPPEERHLQSRLELILWHTEHDSPSKLVESLIEGLRDFVVKHNGVLLSKEHSHDNEGEWVILQSLPSTLNQDAIKCFLINPNVLVSDPDPREPVGKFVPQEEIIKSRREPVLVGSSSK